MRPCRHVRVPGLSPPTRGSLVVLGPGRAAERSIPAHAGEPWFGRRRFGWRWVYPRPRGGATGYQNMFAEIKGLSPPTRGSPRRAVIGRGIPRSIPAHAGEPKHTSPPGPRWRVYPRPRGGADVTEGVPRGIWGLSPPTRGSPGPVGVPDLDAGSIPAHAGKPGCSGPGARHAKVYPRPRGGADLRALAGQLLEGLSPPTRGSLHAPFLPVRNGRSIPAHAGKPLTPIKLGPNVLVYPRPRGEARCSIPLPHWVTGLSPPTRGSQHEARRPAAGEGSIPAHAGKPRWLRGSWWLRGVYPRPRGEASVGSVSLATSAGLSPPTRGSR